MIHVVIAAPALAFRAGLRALISEEEHIRVAAEAAALTDLSELPDNTDVLLLSGEAWDEGALLDLVEDMDALPAVLLVAEDSRLAGELVGLPLRAWGALPSDTSEEELFAAIQALYYGLVAAPPDVIEPLLEGAATGMQTGGIVEELTNREAETLELLAEGLANKQIALALGISEHTVKFHVSSIYSKLGASNRMEAVRTAARLGLISL